MNNKTDRGGPKAREGDELLSEHERDVSTREADVCMVHLGVTVIRSFYPGSSVTALKHLVKKNLQE